jgi:hypothetical protein
MASGFVSGKSLAVGQAKIDSGSWAFTSSQTVVALVDGAPTDGGSVLSANKKIAALFTAQGGTPVYFATGELGGRYATGGTGSLTTTSEIDETVDLSQLAARKHLVIGFYHPGTGFASGTGTARLDVYVDGTDVLSKSFTSLTGTDPNVAAQAFFTNNAVDLGSLASGSTLVGTNNTLSLRVVLTVTSSTAGSGFFGDIIVGDPPPASAPASRPSSASRFAHTAAILGAPGAATAPTRLGERAVSDAMLALPHALA